MALSNLTGWNETSATSACGAGDKPEEKPAAGYRAAKSEMYLMTVLPISGFAKWNHIVIIQDLRNVPSVSCLHSAVAAPQ